MNITTFNRLLKSFQFQEEDIRDLEKLNQEFPFCQLSHILVAKALFDKNDMLSETKIRNAAAYASNRAQLKKIILNKPKKSSKPKTTNNNPPKEEDFSTKPILDNKSEMLK